MVVSGNLPLSPPGVVTSETFLGNLCSRLCVCVCKHILRGNFFLKIVFSNSEKLNLYSPLLIVSHVSESISVTAVRGVSILHKTQLFSPGFSMHIQSVFSNKTNISIHLSWWN